LIVGSSVGFYLWWPRPTLPFEPAGNRQGQTSGIVGHTYFFDTGITALRPVVVTQVTPELDPHSAPGAVGVILCSPGGVRFGGSDSLTGCIEPRTVEQVRVSPQRGDTPWFVVAITPLTSGVVHVTGFNVRYRDHGARTAALGIDTSVDVASP
jgi:hypothetical protein